VSPITPGDEHYEIRSSRIWALLTFQITHFIFPMRMSVDRHGISAREVGSRSGLLADALVAQGRTSANVARGRDRA